MLLGSLAYIFELTLKSKYCASICFSSRQLRMYDNAGSKQEKHVMDMFSMYNTLLIHALPYRQIRAAPLEENRDIYTCFFGSLLASE